MTPRCPVPSAQQVIRAAASWGALTVAVMLGCGGRGTKDGKVEPVESGNTCSPPDACAGTAANPAITGEGGAGGSVEPGVEGGAGGTLGDGGTVGVGGSGGAPVVVTVDTFAGKPNEFGFAWKSSFYLAPCTEVQGYACLSVQGLCPNQHAASFEERGRVFVEEFQLGGELGKTYNVTISVNGIVEGKYYEGGIRRRGADFFDVNNPAGTDAWHIGGASIPSSYDVFKLSVFMPNGTTEVQHYYLNSFPQASGLESHQTVPIGYTATFEVPGQGIIRQLHQDSNCRSVDNCGEASSGTLCLGRNLPNEPGLAVPTSFGGQQVSALNVVNGAAQPFHAQLVHVTVTKVELKP